MHLTAKLTAKLEWDFHFLDSLVHEFKECKIEINRLHWSWKIRHIVRHCRSNENRMSQEPSNTMLQESKRENQTKAIFTSASFSRHLHINLCKWGLCSYSFCLIVPSCWKIILTALFASCPAYRAAQLRAGHIRVIESPRRGFPLFFFFSQLRNKTFNCVVAWLLNLQLKTFKMFLFVFLLPEIS